MAFFLTSFKPSTSWPKHFLKKSKEFLFPHHESISHKILVFWIQTFVRECVSRTASCLPPEPPRTKDITILLKGEVRAAVVSGRALAYELCSQGRGPNNGLPLSLTQARLLPAAFTDHLNAAHLSFLRSIITSKSLNGLVSCCGLQS